MRVTLEQIQRWRDVLESVLYKEILSYKGDLFDVLLELDTVYRDMLREEAHAEEKQRQRSG